MLQTGSRRCFSFLFLLFTLHLSPTLAYFLKRCTIDYPENVTEGVSVDCFNSGLDRIPDDIPGYVKTLILTANKIQKINSTDTLHLSNLTLLDLSENLITHVDDGAFVTLVQLKELRMGGNQLTTLTANMFQGLSSLSILYLAQNNIQFVDSAAFKLLPDLQTLKMTFDQMTDIITILQQLPRLHVLQIQSGDLESFQSKDMPFNMTSELRELIVELTPSIKKFSITTAVFPHLETIDLSFCTAHGLEWDVPDKYFLRNITKVSFNGGLPFNFIRKALQSLDSLAYLKLYDMDNWIKRGILNIACKIPTLRTLGMYSSIYNLTEKLSPCTQLINLDLSYNHLTELSKGSIKQMKQLSHLYLQINILSKVPDDVKHLSMLQILDLSYNHINDLSCSDFLNLTRLTHLHLDNNHISELKRCSFQHLNELKALTLGVNSIWTIGDAFKIGLQKLELLDLNRNVVSGLSQGDFISLKSLKQLDLGLGDVNQWDTYCEGLDALETLGVIFNDYPQIVSPIPPHAILNSLKTFTITFISQTHDEWNINSELISTFFSAMKKLEHFTAENVFFDLPHRDTFKYVPRLKTLTLRRCHLSHLDPEVFHPIQNLESVDLSDNKLKSLDFLAQANLTRVSWLDLSQNELAVIDVSVISFLPALRYVNMGENPFACDCSNSDFQQWVLNNRQTLVAGARHYTCAYPLDKIGTRLLDFDYHFCLVDASFICFVSSTCVIVLTLLTCFTYHFLRLHLLYGYYLFLAFLYDATERKRGSPQRYDAFISYNVHDELWVYRELLPVLEGEQGWRLCLHHRDFPPGKPIIENITDAIYGSRKTICVISHHYLESEWCSREIQMASYRLFDEQKDILILVFLEDIPAHQLSPYYHMKKLVKRQTYLSWPQAAGQHPGLFWQNLRRAMEADTDLGLRQANSTYPSLS